MPRRVAAVAAGLVLVAWQRDARASTDATPPPVTLTAPVSAPNAPLAPGPATPPSPSERNETLLAFFALGSSRLLPGFAAGFGVEVGHVWGRFGVSAVGRYWLPQTISIDDLSAKIRVQVLSFGLRACSFPLNEQWIVTACLGAEIGDMHAEGINIEASRVRFDRWSALVAGLRAGYRVSEHLVPLFGLEFGWALERPEFGYVGTEGTESVYRPPGFALLGQIGFAISL